MYKKKLSSVSLNILAFNKLVLCNHPWIQETFLFLYRHHLGCDSPTVHLLICSLPCQSNLHLAAYPVTIVGLCPCLELTAGRENAFKHLLIILLSPFRREMARLWHVKKGRKHKLVNHKYGPVIFSVVHLLFHSHVMLVHRQFLKV